MARKNKRSQVRKPQRSPGGSARAARPAGLPVPPAAATGETPATPPAQAPAAPGGWVQGPPPGAGGRRGGPPPGEDPPTPPERFPYFPADIRRIALTAALMLVLLIAGSIVLRSMLAA